MILSTYLIGLIEALSAFANSEFLNEFNIENVALGSSVSSASASNVLSIVMEPLSFTIMPIFSRLSL